VIDNSSARVIARVGRDGRIGDVYRQAGAMTFIAEIAPDPATGYYISAPQAMAAWRNRQH
jgi:hypothetical protein